MTMQEFIKQNRTLIDVVIETRMKGQPFRRDDHERRLWVLNDEELYQWAKKAGIYNLK